MATGWPMKTTYANGDVYSASDVNDITGTINLLGSSVAYTAGKNKIINGAFNIWQRGTSFAISGGTGVFAADRFRATGIGNFSRQSFTAGTAPVSGYEGQYFARWNLTSNSQNYDFGQRIEDARTLAGQTATLSFWAKASATTTNAFFPRIFQNFGTGGSPSSSVYTDGSPINLTTSWVRYTATFSIPSVSGKTFGTNNDSYLGVIMQLNTTSVVDIDFWGWQLEQGSTATAFQTASGTIQGELALCQRYYWRAGGLSLYQRVATGANTATNAGYGIALHPVTMRIAPTVIEFSTLGLYEYGGSAAISSLAINQSGNTATDFSYSTSGMTQYRPVMINTQNSLSGYLGFSAEL